MPLFDFKCVKCGREEEKYFSSYDAMQKDKDWQCGVLKTSSIVALNCGPVHCTGFMQRQISAPGSVQIKGFSHVNGYSSPRSITQKRGSVTTTVSGNFEAFADGLHS